MTKYIEGDKVSIGNGKTVYTVIKVTDKVAFLTNEKGRITSAYFKELKMIEIKWEAKV